jgi:MFS family permease
MTNDWQGVQRTYLTLLLLHTLAASFIWGVNTLFLLDAGLTNGQAFAANAFFTAGLVLFEIPTGVIADVRGRRLSYLLGTLTLTVTTLIYLYLWSIKGPFWAWAVTSALLGLGFTFFSGAVEAWLVDALDDAGFTGQLEHVFARGKVISGIAMLAGSVGGGFLAQIAGLGAPYIARTIVLAASFVLAFVVLHDRGFKAQHTSTRKILGEAVHYGLARRSIRWVMLGNFFTDGVSIFAFYAMQPYLLQLYRRPDAYWVAGLAASIVAAAQIGGGVLVSRLTALVARRTTILLGSVILSAMILLAIGLLPYFWAALSCLVAWALVSAMVTPVRQAYVNSLIPSQQRATVLSFDSLIGSTGGMTAQPLLGRAADAWGYPASYVCSAALQALSIPLLIVARRVASTDTEARAADHAGG